MIQKSSQKQAKAAGTIPIFNGADRESRIKRIQPMPLEGLVVAQQILFHYPVGKTTLYKEIKEGTFPRQKAKIGRSVFWDATEVRAYLKSLGATIEISIHEATEADI